MRVTSYLAVLLLCGASAALQAAWKQSEPPASALDQYVQEAMSRQPARSTNDSAGSLYSATSPLADVASDQTIRAVDDIVTILVSDRASAVSKGGTNTSRKSDTKQSVGSIFGKTKPLGPLANLASANGETKIQGQGETSRENNLTTTLTGRVTHVLPNGYFVIEGRKQVSVNSEQQTVTVRGVARPIDIGPGNQVRSDRLAQMEVRVSGKGVVGDAVRRPFILYRLLLGILPF